VRVPFSLPRRRRVVICTRLRYLSSRRPGLCPVRLMSCANLAEGPHPGKSMIVHAMGSWFLRISGVGRWSRPKKLPVR
jgi:hypothetical protein